MTAIPPLDTESDAMTLPVVRAIYDAFREGRATLTAGTAAMLSDALVSAGVRSAAYDSRILMHLADVLEPHAASVVAGWVGRAYEAGRAAGGPGREMIPS